MVEPLLDHEHGPKCFVADQLECVCDTPRIASGAGWVVGHLGGCAGGQYSEGALPCDCGHSSLAVYPLHDGALGAVIEGELRRYWKCCHECENWLPPTDSPSDAPWREAWERAKDQARVSYSKITDQLVQLLGPGVTWEGVGKMEMVRNPQRFEDAYPDYVPGDPPPPGWRDHIERPINPLNLSRPELRRLEALPHEWAGYVVSSSMLKTLGNIIKNCKAHGALIVRDKDDPVGSEKWVVLRSEVT